MSDTSIYLEEVAVVRTPQRLAALTRVFLQQGQELVTPSAREGLHPLLVPLTSSGSDLMCLLRWPDPSTHKAMPLPLVRTQRGALNMTLVARTVDEYLHRLLAEEDAAGGPTPVADAAGADGLALFKAGDIEAADMAGKLPMYLIRKVGMFPDVCETLSLKHLQRNDQTSAMVASEWYMRNNHFTGWARPYEFASEVFGRLNRGEEARDFARYALRCPWWSAQQPFTALQATAQIPGPPERVMYMLSEEAAAAAGAVVNKLGGYKDAKSPQQLALERAHSLMNCVAAGVVEGGYAAIRADLAVAYKEAGLNDVANFILAA